MNFFQCDMEGQGQQMREESQALASCFLLHLAPPLGSAETQPWSRGQDFFTHPCLPVPECRFTQVGKE